MLEVSATADVLSYPALIHTINSGISHDAGLRESAIKQASEWEKKEGYYSLLQDVLLDPDTSDDIKALAATQLKNGLDKYWRKSAVNAIKAPERDRIRSRALASCLGQRTTRVVRLSAICAAKIARVDFPNAWPDLLIDLVSCIKALTEPHTDVKLMVNTLFTTVELVKELVTLRISKPRQMIEAATPDFIGSLIKVYEQNRSIYFSETTASMWNPNNSTDRMVLAMEANLRILKMLRRLAVLVFHYPHEHSVVFDIWNLCHRDLGSLLKSITSWGPSPPIDSRVNLATRHLRQVLKLHHGMASMHPVSFAFLPDAIPLARLYLENASLFRQKQIEADDWHFDEISNVLVFWQLKAIQLQRACLKLVFSSSQSLQYRSAQRKEQYALAQNKLRGDLYTLDYQLIILDEILGKYLTFLPSDFEEWESEAEQWTQREEGDESVHEREVRPCSERLLLDILINSKEGPASIKQHALKRIAEGMRSEQITIKEASFSAIGIIAPCLSEGDFDYANFVRDVMVPEIRRREPMQSILRRRVAIVAAQWAVLDGKIKEHDRGVIYDIFSHILDPLDELNTEAVRITTGKRLEAILQELEFEADVFSPHITTILSRLANLIQEVELTDTKLALLSTVAILVERMQSAVNSFAPDIVGLLEPLWTTSESEANAHAMKSAIIQVLCSLLKTTTLDMRPLHPKLLPVIQNALDPRNQLELLHEDALNLWQLMLRFSQPPLTAELASLQSIVISLLDAADWKTANVLAILKSYILLSPEHILDDSSRDHILTGLASFMDCRGSKHAQAAAECIRLILKSAGAIGGETGLRILNHSLYESRLIERMLQALRLVHQSKTRPESGRASMVDPLTIEQQLTVFASMILSSGELFIAHVEAFASESREHQTQVFDWLLDEWFEAMETVAELQTLKLLMLALTRLFELGITSSRLQDMLYHWTSALIQIRKDDEDPFSDSQCWQDGDLVQPEISDDPEEQRARNLRKTDPVCTVNLARYVQSLMSAALAQSGSLDAFKATLLSSVDKNVAEGFLDLGVLQ